MWEKCLQELLELIIKDGCEETLAKEDLHKEYERTA